MKRRYTLLIIMTLILAVLSGLCSANAQDRLPKKTVSVDFHNKPIRSAIEQLLSETDLKYSVEPAIDVKVNLKLNNVPLRDALSALLRSNDLTGRIENGVFIVCAKPKEITALENDIIPPGLRRADSAEQKVRVGLISTVGYQQSLVIAYSHSCDIVDATARNKICPLSNEQIILTAEKDGIGITVFGSPLGTYKGPIRLTPGSNRNAFEIVSPKVRRARYRGVLEIRGGSALTVVNELPMEDYVRGAVPMEVPKSFHPEAQKALVVAIRTYALKSLKRHATSGYNLCDSIHCQGFAGASREAPWIDEIVDETRGQIIVYNGEPIYAVYSSDCGGATQNNEDAGIGREPWPYLRSVVDNPSGQETAASNPQCEDYCAGSPSHTWSKSFTAEELGRIFSRSSATKKIGKFQSLEFADYDCSGRVKTAIIRGDKGEHRMTGNQFRETLGLSVIKSTKMTLTTSPDGKYAIEGKGYGHGVGLCAFGANGLAKSRKGITYVDILKHYYTGVDVKNTSDLTAGGLMRQ